jgi:hypothetical protein
VIKYAKEHGNKAAKRHFGLPPTEKIICERRKLEEKSLQLEKNKHSFPAHIVK